MDRCGIARAAVAGFSLGGMIARRFALDHPDRLSALAILNSPHDRSPAQRDAVRKRVRQTEAQGPSANLEPALERWFTPAFRAEEPEAVALVRTWITRNDPADLSADIPCARRGRCGDRPGVWSGSRVRPWS